MMKARMASCLIVDAYGINKYTSYFESISFSQQLQEDRAWK